MISMQSQLGQVLGIELRSSRMLGKNTITDLTPYSRCSVGKTECDAALTRLTRALPPFTGDCHHTWTSHVFFDILKLCTQAGTRR